MAKISFNPSTATALTQPPNNKDITFDLRGHNIFARGVEFKGTDTNTWRSVTINGTSLGTKTLELKNGNNISITANGTISAINLASSSHTHPLVINGKSFSLGTTSQNLGTYVPWTSNGYSLNVATKSGNDVDTGGGLYIEANTGIQFYLWLHDTSNVWYKKTASGSWKKMDAGNADTWNGYSAQLTTENTSSTKLLVVDGNNVQYRTLSSILAGQNTWRTVQINGTSIGTNVLNLKNGSNIVLNNSNGQVTISANGLASSSHLHDDRYLKLSGGTMVGDIYFSGDNKISWSRNTDSASISFKNTGDADTDSYMSFVTSDNGNEYFRWSHTSSTNVEWMSLKADGLRIKGTKVSLENHQHTVVINGTTKTISNSTTDLGYYLPQNGQIAGWGVLTSSNGYTAITHFDLGSRGAFALAGKNNQMFMQLDGTIYVNEGSQEVATKPWVESKGYVTGSINGNTITINGVSTTWRNTWRDIKINNSSISTNALNIIQGDNITITNSNGTARISTTGLASSSHTHNFITTIGKTTIDNTSYTINRFNTIFYYNSGGPTTYGNILSVVDQYSGGGQLALPWSGNQTKADGTDTAVERLKYRSKRDNIKGWTVWKTIPYMEDLTWNNVTEKPSTFTPSAHSHSWQSITDKIIAGNEFNIVNSGYNNTMWFNYLPVDDRTKTANVTQYRFGNGNKGYSNLYANSYIKNGSDDNYVLLGGGGHEALSKLNSSHNHDGRYAWQCATIEYTGRLDYSGFFQRYNDSGEVQNNVPFTSWVHLINCQHSNTANNYALQIAASFYNNSDFKIRVTNDSDSTAWNTIIHSGNYTAFVSDKDHTHSQYIKRTGDTMSGPLNFANGTWNLVGDDSYIGDCNIAGHFGIKAANTTYPGIAFYNSRNELLGKLTAYSGNIRYGDYSLQFLDNGNTTVTSSTLTNPFSTYNASAIADNQAICIWGQASKLTNLSSDTGDISLWLRRINASTATLNMVLDGEYYANGNQRLAHVSELDAKLNRQKLQDGTWNPRYTLVADYTYNGGDVSFSENNKQMHISIDGYFWQNEGNYRVLDTSDINTWAQTNISLAWYLGSTDNTWYPIVWGGSTHANTDSSTGQLYKSHDVLSWQTSTQTLQATNLRAGDMHIGAINEIYTTAYDLYINHSTRGGKNVLICTGKGNVGIGTISPGYKLTVNGTSYISGVLQTASEIRTSSPNAFRLNYGSYGVFHRNDGADYYILLTNKGDVNGNWNSYRPFSINLASGIAHLNGYATNANLADVANRLYSSDLTDLNSPSQWNTNNVGLVFNDFNDSASNKPQSVNNANAVLTLLKSKHGADGQYSNQLSFADNNTIYTRYSNNGNWSSWAKLITSENITDYYWANVKISANSNTQTQPSVNTIYANNWFRSQGATGWYSESYCGGWYMNDTNWIRAYNNKGIYSSGRLGIGEIASTGTDLKIYSSTLYHQASNDFPGIIPRVISAFSFKFTSYSGNKVSAINICGYSANVIRLGVGRYYADINTDYTKATDEGKIFGVAFLNDTIGTVEANIHQTLKVQIIKLGIYNGRIQIKLTVSDDNSENDMYDTNFDHYSQFYINCYILRI